MGLEIAAALAIVSATAQVQQGRAQEKAFKRQAEIDTINADRAMVSARDKADRIRRRGLLILGAQRALRASTGGTLSGGFLDIQAQTARASETDALNAIFQGSSERFNFQGRAALSRFEGALSKQKGQVGAFNQILGFFGSKEFQASGGVTSSTGNTASGASAFTQKDLPKQKAGFSTFSFQEKPRSFSTQNLPRTRSV